MQDELAKKNITWIEAKRSAKNRVRWRSMVDALCSPAHCVSTLPIKKMSNCVGHINARGHARDLQTKRLRLEKDGRVFLSLAPCEPRFIF